LLEKKFVSKPTTEALVDMFDIPVFSKEDSNGKRVIKQGSLREFAQTVSRVDFADPDSSVSSSTLLAGMEDTIKAHEIQKSAEYHLLIQGLPEFVSSLCVVV